MVDHCGDADPTAYSYPLRRFFNRLQPQGTAWRRVSRRCRTAPCAVHRRTRFSRGDRDSSTGSPGRAGHKCDFSSQIGGCVRTGHGYLHTGFQNPTLNSPCCNGPEVFGGWPVGISPSSWTRSSRISGRSHRKSQKHGGCRVPRVRFSEPGSWVSLHPVCPLPHPSDLVYKMCGCCLSPTGCLPPRIAIDKSTIILYST